MTQMKAAELSKKIQRHYAAIVFPRPSTSAAASSPKSMLIGPLASITSHRICIFSIEKRGAQSLKPSELELFERLGPSRQHRFRTLQHKQRCSVVALAARIITSSTFENFIMACIVMQLCVLMMALGLECLGTSQNRWTTSILADRRLSWPQVSKLPILAMQSFALRGVTAFRQSCR